MTSTMYDYQGEMTVGEIAKAFFKLDLGDTMRLPTGDVVTGAQRFAEPGVWPDGTTAITLWFEGIEEPVISKNLAEALPPLGWKRQDMTEGQSRWQYIRTGDDHRDAIVVVVEKGRVRPLIQSHDGHVTKGLTSEDSRVFAAILTQASLMAADQQFESEVPRELPAVE